MREGINTGQILINLVYAEKNLDQVEQEKRDQLLAKLSSEAKRRQQITTFLITQNNGLGDTVSPALPTSILRGKGYIYESLTRIQKQQKEINNKTIVIEEGTIKEKDNKTKTDKDTNKDITCTFKISPLSFFQTNTHGAESMIDIIIEFLGNHEAKTLLDLYCGTGSLGISLLKNSIGQKLIGIEILPEAIEDARHNAQINDIEDKVYFNAGKAEVLIYKDEHIQQQLQDINTIIVDPPRSGLHKKVISFLNKLKQTHDFVLAYISCNPVTLARDCEKLTKNEFKLQKIQALDMFPQTSHVETIALLK